jgi:hypothetical protein
MVLPLIRALLMKWPFSDILTRALSAVAAVADARQRKADSNNDALRNMAKFSSPDCRGALPEKASRIVPQVPRMAAA